MPEAVGVIGATSLLGSCLSTLLIQSGYQVVAFSRRQQIGPSENMKWYRQGADSDPETIGKISFWFSAAPIWVLPDYFGLIEESCVQGIVALSSTSRFTKDNSRNHDEQTIAHRLIDGESRLRQWAGTRDIKWTILRPTMIYGLGKDTTVSEIARLIRRWRFFPVLGDGSGLRQPIHVEDIAQACLGAMTSPAASCRSFNISGAETLTFEAMIKRIFMALNLKPRIIHVPRWCFQAAISGMRTLPRFRNWKTTMADRMSSDMVFDHEDARSAFGFSPRPFLLESRDLPGPGSYKT